MRLRNLLLFVIVSATLAACGNSSTRGIRPMEFSVMEPECTFIVTSYATQVVTPGIGRIIVERKCPERSDPYTEFSVFTALSRVPPKGTVVQVLESFYDFSSSQHKETVLFLK